MRLDGITQRRPIPNESVVDKNIDVLAECPAIFHQISRQSRVNFFNTGHDIRDRCPMDIDRREIGDEAFQRGCEMHSGHCESAGTGPIYLCNGCYYCRAPIIICLHPGGNRCWNDYNDQIRRISFNPENRLPDLKKHLTLFLFVFLISCSGESEYNLAQEAFLKGNYETALAKFTPLAKSGDAKAQSFLGLMYEREYGVDQDYAAAFQWYQKAAEQGLADAQVRLAKMYIKGTGIPRDYWEAMKWSRLAAVQGNAEAEAHIGYMFHDGIGVKQDYAEAVKWYTKAANKGWINAIHDLGVMYQNGRGVKQDYAKAIELYRRAADRGYPYSQDNLVNMYRQGLGVPKDNQEALQWYLEVAKNEHVTEQFMLGTIYRAGRGVRQDNIRAYAWLGIAAAGGMQAAQVFRDNLESQITAGELEEARKLSRELWEKYGNRKGKD